MPLLKRFLPVFLGVCVISIQCPAETLYNGIQLPDTWPPKPDSFPRETPLVPPYLKNPPKVIPIDVGRQLFVDDFLVESTTMTRSFHLPEQYEKNPVMGATTSYDKWRDAPFAAPFSDGVWFDPTDKIFKMWYLAGTGFAFGYALSSDGLSWVKPPLEKGFSNSNVLDTQPFSRDSSTVWMNLDDPNPERRFKMTYYRAGLQTRFSADGIQWGDVVVTHNTGDRTTMFYNPFRKVWVYSIRTGRKGVGRCRYYCETSDMGKKSWESLNELSLWTCADSLDRVRKIKYEENHPDLYNLDATPYESLMLGLFTIHAQVADEKTGRPKLNSVTLGYSRDGFHWDRPDRRPFLDASDDPKAWNWGNVQSAGGGCLVVGDKLYFYFSGRNSGRIPDDGSGGATGLAFLRRDGFASMGALNKPETLTTRPIRFLGKHLFVNADVNEGELRAEVLDLDGKVIEPFSLANCQASKTDKTLQPITWKAAPDLSTLTNRPVKIRFQLTNGKLYAFWVSPEKTGSSHGYVAAGGPGFTGHRDTAGEAVE